MLRLIPASESCARDASSSRGQAIAKGMRNLTLVLR